ncbi:MAG: DNA-3-methyladenine glycosylase [Oligoflexia bacterium]|nr:DNA-3-methyladenine glycosylase [Oligoflexia bacterium]
MLIKQSFFSRSAIEVAPELIGCTLKRVLPSGEILSGTIVETEAYLQNDPACHAYRGITKRNAVMFGPAGFSYVYFIYGVHFCFNVVTGDEGVGEAVLIRALDVGEDGGEREGESGNGDFRIAAGPGKLCKFMRIDKSLNGVSLFANSECELTITKCLSKREIKKIPLTQCRRIGIREGKEFLWRWYWTGNRAVSVRNKS